MAKKSFTDYEQSLYFLRACLHGGGGPQIGEVTCGGSPHLSCERDQIKMRDYVDRRVTHQSGLPHLPEVPHLHVNRPLVVSSVSGFLVLCYCCYFVFFFQFLFILSCFCFSFQPSFPFLFSQQTFVYTPTVSKTLFPFFQRLTLFVFSLRVTC